jgi:hypothetical protein
MNPLALLTVGSLLAGIPAWLDDHPQVFLGCKCQWLPGEKETDYIKRELDRKDGIMQKMFAVNDRKYRELLDRLRQSEQDLKDAERYTAKRKADAESLQALGGGIASHPKSGYAVKLDAEAELFNRKLAAWDEQERKDAEARKGEMTTTEVNDLVRRSTAELRAATKRLQEEAAKKNEKR